MLEVSWTVNVEDVAVVAAARRRSFEDGVPRGTSQKVAHAERSRLLGRRFGCEDTARALLS